MGSPGETATVAVRLLPRSSRPGVRSFAGGVLELKVAAPPVEGRANEEARRLLAGLLGVAKAKVILARGGRSRSKVFAVAGMTQRQIREKLELAVEKP
jgi:uncharacterized protein YggU (UPF0235/DUF167 family)